MTRTFSNSAVGALLLSLAAGCSADATPAIPGSAPAGSGGIVTASVDSGPRCEIRTAGQGRMLVVESWIVSPEPVSGRADIAIEGVGRAGATRIAQSAGFTATPDAPALVGRSMLMGGALYDVSLTADAGGETLTCTERVGDMT